MPAKDKKGKKKKSNDTVRTFTNRQQIPPVTQTSSTIYTSGPTVHVCLLVTTTRLLAPDVLPAPTELQVVLDGVSMPFAEYTKQFTRTFYPEYRDQTIVIPPLTFYDRTSTVTNFKDTGTLDDRQISVLQNVKVQERPDSLLRGEEAEHRVVKRLKDLIDREGWKVAIICSAKFGNYLNKLDKSANDVKRPLNRGEHDVILVHPLYGVIIICVKSVGSNFADLTPEDIRNGERERRVQKVLDKAVEQMQKEVTNARHVLSDLSPPISVVLALPCLPRQLLTFVFQKHQYLKQKLETIVLMDYSAVCLCLEELPPFARKRTPRLSSDNMETAGFSSHSSLEIDKLSSNNNGTLKQSNSSDCLKEYHASTESACAVDTWESHQGGTSSALSLWFEGWGQKRKQSSNADTGLSEEQYLEIVGRYCCLYSTVEIPSRSKSEGRMEVRVMPEAVAEVNARFRALILHKFQSDLLVSPSSRVYMYGVMGSGKSVMLTLRARYWLAQGFHVVIINVSYDVEGSPIGYALLQAVNEGLDCSTINKAVIVNIRLTTFDPQAFLDTLTRLIPESERKTTHFCVDEVYAQYHPIFECLKEKFSQSEIWAAGLDGFNAPFGFEKVEMKKVLRCPPTVQRVLKFMDYSNDRTHHYTTCGAEEGLPAEGPVPKFIFHEKHTSTEVAFPLQCKTCAMEVMTFLQRKLGLAPACSTDSTVELESSGATSFAREQRASPMELATSGPASLSIQDIVILCKDSQKEDIYSRVGDVYKLDTDRYERFNNTVDQSVFVGTLREAGYPVRTVRSSSSGELAENDEDAITASWVNPASGLEWAVVLYMPGDPARGSEDVGLSGNRIGSREEGEEGVEDQLDSDLRETRRRMTDRDCEYLFWSASRCTAQLIVMVP